MLLALSSSLQLIDYGMWAVLSSTIVAMAINVFVCSCCVEWQLGPIYLAFD